MSTPMPGFSKSLRETAESMFKNIPLARVLFYASTVVAASEEIAKVLANGESIVLDRYWLSTMAYHRFLGVTAELNEVASELICPDATFLLNVPAEIRRQRISQRGEFMEHDFLTLNTENERKIIQEYRELSTLPVAGVLKEVGLETQTVEELGAHILKQTELILR